MIVKSRLFCLLKIRAKRLSSAGNFLSKWEGNQDRKERGGASSGTGSMGEIDKKERKEIGILIEYAECRKVANLENREMGEETVERRGNNK